MIFAVTVLVLLVISFLWALFSLRKDTKHPKELKHAKKELFRERILYKRN